MNYVFSERAWEDYLHWQRTDRAMLQRVNRLIEAIAREPYAGVGKPKALRHALAGWWSRRIDHEHRLVYRVEEADLFILQLRQPY